MELSSDDPNSVCLGKLLLSCGFHFFTHMMSIAPNLNQRFFLGLKFNKNTWKTQTVIFGTKSSLKSGYEGLANAVVPTLGKAEAGGAQVPGYPGQYCSRRACLK